MKKLISLRWRFARAVVAGLLLTSVAVHAQTSEETKKEQFTVGIGGEGAGTVMAFTIRLDDVGEKLLARLDADSDGGASYAEFSTALRNHFNQWDTDRTGTLSTNELTAGIRSVFPAPKIVAGHGVGGQQAPAGAPVKVIKRVTPDGQTVVRRVRGSDAGGPPEPPVLIANRVIALADTDKNNEISVSEWEAAGIQWFKTWDFNENNLLSADDLADGFHRLAGPPDDEDVILFIPE